MKIYLQFEWKQFSRGLNSTVPFQCYNPLCLFHIHYNKQPQKHRPRNIVLISSYVFHFNTGPRAWIQFLFTFPTFLIIFFVSPTPHPPCLCLVFSSFFVTESELQRNGIISACSQLARRQVSTQHCYSFAVWLVSIFSSASNT